VTTPADSRPAAGAPPLDGLAAGRDRGAAARVEPRHALPVAGRGRVRRARPAHDVPRPADRLRRTNLITMDEYRREYAAGVRERAADAQAAVRFYVEQRDFRRHDLDRATLAVAADGKACRWSSWARARARAPALRARGAGDARRPVRRRAPGVSETSAWPDRRRAAARHVFWYLHSRSAGTTPPAHCSWGARSSRTCAG